MKEVIAATKRVSGVDFAVRIAPRRAGDPMAIVADNALIQATLGWVPQYNNLDNIVKQALDWERKLHNL